MTHIWKWRFIGKIELLSLTVLPNGGFIATFDDRKLFVGHKILINGNVNGELLNSVIVEDFNIEDYKKVEVALPITESITETKINNDEQENKE